MSNNLSREFYSNGKLLITGEYLVLQGALALALPTKFGQNLIVCPSDSLGKIHWKSYTYDGALWQNIEIFYDEIVGFVENHASKEDFKQRLLQVLFNAHQLNPNIISDKTGFTVITKLTFPSNWGLGSSSTFINNISQWFNIDPYQLLSLTFGGSGYDIACAQHSNPIVYQLQNNIPVVKSVSFNPDFKDKIYFLHLNKKQNSRLSIEKFNSVKSELVTQIQCANSITTKALTVSSFSEFQDLMIEHEDIISKILSTKRIQEQLFQDFNGVVKSLGGWGGDFVMVLSENNPQLYFKEKGYDTLLTYNEMILV